MSAELIYKTDQNLNQILRLLNGLFLKIAQSDGKKEIFAKIFKYVLDAFEKRNSQKLLDFLENISNSEKLATSHHKKMFSYIGAKKLTSITPWLGNKATKSSYLFCKDLVIGLILTSKEGVLRYRLDFDEKKLLHVNLDFIFYNNKKECQYNFAITGIGFPSRYYVVKENTVGSEAVKFKFFTKMSMAYYKSLASPQADNIFTDVLNKTDCDDLSEVMNNKASRDVFFSGVLEEYTGKREDKKARIAHQVEFLEKDSENSSSDTSNKI